MSGYIGDLSKEQEAAVESLKNKLIELNLLEKLSKTDREREILRFLRARKFDVDKTLEMIKNYVAWREEKKHDKLTALDFKDVTHTRALVYMGKDKNGVPSFAVFPARHVPNSLDYDQVENMFVLIVDALFEKYKDVETVNCLFCYDNWGLSCVDRKMDALIMKVGQDYYPERLGKAFLVNPPWFFSTVWTILKPFLDQKTVEKICFLSSDYKEELLKHFDEDQLLTVFGGKAKETTAYELLSQLLSKEQLQGFEQCKKPTEEDQQQQQQQEASSGWFGGFF